MRLRLERLFVTALNLPCTVLLAIEDASIALHVGVAERVDTGLGEEDRVDGGTLLHGLGADVGRVDQHLSGVVTIPVDTGCTKKTPRFRKRFKVVKKLARLQKFVTYV